MKNNPLKNSNGTEPPSNRWGQKTVNLLVLLGSVAIGGGIFAAIIRKTKKDDIRQGISKREDEYEYADMLGV